MIHAVIIDDQEFIREVLRDMIETHFYIDVKIVGEAPNIKSGIPLIRNLKPDLVFLDIEMPGGSGFDLLEQVKDINFSVVIITSHEDFALKAIKYSALDYLLKPINEHELINTIKNYINRKSNVINKQNQLQLFLETMRKLKSGSNEIGLQTGYGVVFVKLENIIRCQSYANQTDLFFKDNTQITVSYPIKEVESILSEAHFLRVHDSAIINLQQIRQYNVEEGIALMNDGTGVDISGKMKTEFKKRMSELEMIFN